uniref:Uncharacterized protein n=1 Tax=Daphnia galeata TaxID=27404 RepID=A0A8J2RVT7_9CRUS|nr:unnamed protein product [Daphnia galeata]
MKLEDGGASWRTEVEYLRLFLSLVTPASNTPGGDSWPSRFCSRTVGNKKASECPKCQDRCPAGGDGRRLCWNNDDCQKGQFFLNDLKNIL